MIEDFVNINEKEIGFSYSKIFHFYTSSTQTESFLHAVLIRILLCDENNFEKALCSTF